MGHIWKLVSHTGCVGQKRYLRFQQASVPRKKESALTQHLDQNSITSFELTLLTDIKLAALM